MTLIKRSPRKIAVLTCSAVVAGAAVIGAAGTAFADGAPTPSSSTSSAVVAGAAPGATKTPGAAKGAAGKASTPHKHGRGARAHTPHIGGDVGSVSGTTVTVTDRDGFTRTIHLTPSVNVTRNGATSSASAINRGEHIEAIGSVASDGTTLDAATVSIGKPAPHAHAGRASDAGRGPRKTRAVEGGRTNGEAGRATDGITPSLSSSPSTGS